MQNTLRRITKSPFSQKVIFLSPQNLSLIIISFGILVRLVPYLSNRSLWADEAVLALNIIQRNYLQLLQPLDYDQGAPIGFLWLSKLAVQVFGNNEYALRLLPLLSGIASLWLFYRLAQRCLQPLAIPIALALFASLDDLVYYSSELKQYSTDVAVALLCCLMVMQLHHTPKLERRQIVIYSLTGAIAIWFSHPAIFVLASVAIACGLGKPEAGRHIRKVLFMKRMPKLLGIYTTWLLSFALFYLVSLNTLSSSKGLLESWQSKSAFPTSALDINWSYESFIKFFTNPLGFDKSLVVIALIAFVAGCVSFLFRSKIVLLALIFPLFVTLFAAYLYKYPFRGRLVLFLTPFFILIIAEGADYIRRRTNYKFTYILGVLFLLLLLAPPVITASSLIVKPYVREEIKPAISYVKSQQLPGDILYVYQRGEYQFKYYANKYGYSEGEYIIGVDDLDEQDGKDVSKQEWERYKSDLDKLRGKKRVWVLFSHIDDFMHEKKMILTYLDSMGKQVDAFNSPGAFVYLYDLTQETGAGS